MQDKHKPGTESEDGTCFRWLISLGQARHSTFSIGLMMEEIGFEGFI